jgi:molybdenum cofactor cytidylyltransferase
MVEVAAILLAAGASSRFKAAGGGNATKLAAPLAGKPLVRHAAEAALASATRPIIVVTGHDRTLVEAALAALDLRFVHNSVYRRGLSSSLQAGVAALPASVAGALVLLGDMPGVTAALLDGLIAAFERRPEVFAVAPIVEGRRGNPALLARALFPSVAALAGDEGARKLLDNAAPDKMVTVEISGPASILDVDTPLSLAEARRLWEK